MHIKNNTIIFTHVNWMSVQKKCRPTLSTIWKGYKYEFKYIIPGGVIIWNKRLLQGNP